MLIKENQKVVFIGDSVTDADKNTSQPLGNGYVRYVYGLINSTYPNANIKIVNKGIGGNNVIDLKNRWEQDVFEESPDWLFLLV